MKMRILIFEDEDNIRRPLCNFLRAKGHEVLDFPTPTDCPLVSGRLLDCQREHACADLVITDMNMPGMTGLELVRRLAASECHIPRQNRIVISSSLTASQEAEFRALGCRFLPKPFLLNDLWEIIQSLEQSIPPSRELVPVADLVEALCC